MRHELIICTKDRPDDLRRCLESIAAQTQPPDRVLVIDGSDTTPEAHVKSVVTAAHRHAEVIRTAPGLTRQRNEGLRRLLPDTEIVHFVDDDSVLESNYCEQILAAFAPGVAAVGGCITNLPVHQPTRVQCFLRLDSERQGVLLRTGVNVLNYTGDSVRETEWLSGCAMSYRRVAIMGMEFDETRRGAGFGEDVDFSARCRARGPLVWTPQARIEHRQSTQERLPDSQVTRRWIRNRGKLAVDRVGGVRLRFVFLGTFAEAALVAAWALRDRDRALARRALAVLLGLWDIVMRKPV